MVLFEVIIEVLASLAITIVILVAVYISSIIVKVVAGYMAAAVVSGAAAAAVSRATAVVSGAALVVSGAAVVDDSSFASINEGRCARPSVHHSRTLAVVFTAVAIIKASFRASNTEAPAAFDGAVIEATATIVGLKEVAASTSSAIITEEAIAIISSEVAINMLAIIAWVVIVVAVGFTELRVGLGRANAGHSQALALNPPRKDHLLHLHTHTHHHSHLTHHRSHLLRRSSPQNHRYTFLHFKHHNLKGLVGRFGRASMLKDSVAPATAASLVTSLHRKEKFTGLLPFPKVRVQFQALPVFSRLFLVFSELFATI